MPYLPMVEREYVNAGEQLKTAGQLNYKLYKKLVDEPFIKRDDLLIFMFNAAVNLHEHTNKNYQGSNDVVGALACCQLEFARRKHNHPNFDMVIEVFDTVLNKFYKDITAPYEVKKIKENGDVDGSKKC